MQPRGRGCEGRVAARKLVQVAGMLRSEIDVLTFEIFFNRTITALKLAF